MMADFDEIEWAIARDQYESLRRAALDIYSAGYWTCDREVDEAALWTALRDALGLPTGTSPSPIPGSFQRPQAA